MITIENKPINVGTRLTTMILDHFIMTIIAMVFVLPSLLSTFFTDIYDTSNESTNSKFMGGPIFYIALFGFAVYLCKDSINGRSIAKRILKLQVVDNKTGEVASPLQCLVRNMFCVLWIIEVIVAMTNTSRRIGDRVAGTKLVNYDTSLEQPKLNISKIALSVTIAYGLILIPTILLPSVTMAKTNYSATSYNVSESKELEKLITDSLGEYLTPDIRVYDSVKNSKLKYMSTILRLKENYISDDGSYNQLYNMTTNLIYSKMPMESFTGWIKYVYRGNGQFQSRSTMFGTKILSKETKP